MRTQYKSGIGSCITPKAGLARRDGAHAGKISEYLAAWEDFINKFRKFLLFCPFLLLFCQFIGYFFNFFNKYCVWEKNVG